ncbi:MAG: S9 family peptidase [Chloroflexaceae bacterium]|nr:S9 family peptidase [Chloroflexaceae bacterium]
MAPYGLWNSPLSPRSLAGGIRLSDVQWDSDGRTLVWLEGRGGQGVLVGAAADCPDAPRDLTDRWSVRARVGYGGGDFTVAGGQVFFVEQSGRLYRQSLQGGPARPITPAFGNAAAPTISPDGRWVLFVHSYEGEDVLAVVDAEGKQWPQRLVTGSDFFMQPRWHPDGKRLAYLAWNHPQMPWDGTVLYLATLDDGAELPVVREAQVLAGAPDVAVFQPEFSPDGRWLAYVSDQRGWSHIFLYDLEQHTHRALMPASLEAECSLPAWVQGMRTYGWSYDSQSLVAIHYRQGTGQLYRHRVDIDVDIDVVERAEPGESPGEPEPVTGALESCTWFEQLALSPRDDRLAVIASASTQPARVVVQRSRLSVGEVRILRRSTSEMIAPAALSRARPVTWKSTDGVQVYGLLYAPARPDEPTEPGAAEHQPAEAEIERGLPPAMVLVHGGPTAQAVTRYQDDVQFFTTRGYLVLQVNYRGSTGYGRSYMEALRRKWGVFDVEDVVSGAHYLMEEGLADGNRLVIMGKSAGGYTVLETLCRASGVFRAGICLYGISNLFSIAADTHKLEARYLDSLLGPLPEASAVYRERSPLFHAHLLNDPIAMFQGTDDRVVPQAQSDAIVQSLRKRGVPHEYHVYEGEGHGWRKAETIEAFYQAVEAFLRQYVLFA